MKKISALLFLCTLTYFGNAQDPHFSQFFASPLTLNPALTGKFDGTLRAAGNYRNQWPAIGNVYTTATLSVDFPILKAKLPDYDTWGVGIMALNDQAGGVLTNNYVGLSTSYHKALDEDGFQQLGIGFQGVYGQKRLNTTKLQFEDMLTINGFTGVSQDQFSTPFVNINYFDVNAGMLYTASTNDDNNFYIGASMYHINRPKESFKEGGSWNIAARTTISAGGYFPVAENLTLHTSGVYQYQNGASETNIGGALAAVIDPSSENPSNVYIGSWYRFNDAIIPYLGLEFSGFRLGATYDINISSLKSASQSRGGMEISLIYIKKPAGSKGIPCPKF